MKSKPAVRDHFYTIYISCIAYLNFTNNLALLTGKTLQGTTAFLFVKECMQPPFA